MLKKLTRSGEYTHMFIIVLTLIIYYVTPSINFRSLVVNFDAAPIGNWILGQTSVNPQFVKPVNILLILGIVLYFNSISTSSDILPRQSYITASLITIFMLFSPQENYFTSSLCVVLLLSFSLGNMAGMFGRQYPYLQVLNASMAISISSMIFPYTILFIFFVWFGFLTYSVNSWREWVISVIGLILPYIYLLFAFFWNDNLNFILNSYNSFFKNLSINFSLPSTDQLITLSLLTLFYLMSMFKFISEASDKIISIRKRMWLTFQFSFICLVVMALSGNSIYLILPVIYVPLALMLSYSLHNQRRSRIYNVLLVLLIVSIIINRLVSFYA